MLDTRRERFVMTTAVVGLATAVLMANSWSLYRSYTGADREIREASVKYEVQAIRKDLAEQHGDWNIRFVSREEYHDFERRIEARLKALEQRLSVSE